MIARLALLGRLFLAFALLAPHGARVEAGGLTLVICGADGPYEIVLPGAPPAPHADMHDCCLGACAAFAASLPLAGARPAPRASHRLSPPVMLPRVPAATLPPPARGPPLSA